MFSLIIKRKHTVTGVFERTFLWNNKQKIIKGNTFQRLLCTNPASSPEDYGKVVNLDASEVEMYEEKPLKKTRRIKRKLYELEEKHFRKKKDPDENSATPEMKFREGLMEMKKNEELFRKITLHLSSKSQRVKEERILIDNKKIIADAINAGFKPSIIFYSRKSDVDTLNLDSSIKLCRVHYKQLQLWADIVTSQGVVGVFQKPSKLLKVKEENPENLPITVICDGIRDPGNMGSMLRVAAGVGCKKFILTKGCVDIWNPKVIRSSAGAHFQFPYLYDMEWEDIENEISEECQVFLADLKDFCCPEALKNVTNKEQNRFEESLSGQLPILSYSSVSFEKQEITLVIGNESFGLSENAYLLANKRKGSKVFIPMSNGISSLNSSVALGILLYEIRRQIEKKKPVTVESH